LSALELGVINFTLQPL